MDGWMDTWIDRQTLFQQGKPIESKARISNGATANMQPKQPNNKKYKNNNHIGFYYFQHKYNTNTGQMTYNIQKSTKKKAVK